MTGRSLWLALPCLLAVTAPALAEDRLPPPSVSVSGEARDEARPDIALITFEVSTERPTSVEAGAENARAVAAVIDALKASPLDDKDLTTVGASLTPVYSEQRDTRTNQYIKSVVTSYRARNQIRVRVRDIERTGAIVGAAVQAGALYEGLAYDLSDREQRIDALRVKAAANAVHRAGLYAEGLGVKVGPPRTLVASGGQTEPAPMMMAKSFAAADMRAPAPPPLQIEPGTINLTETVTATFDLLTP